MSTLYNLEPQPTAKAILHTTSGDISLELFAQQTPVTSRNFLQLCLDGYYDNTIFHRLVPGFVIQGGDPTGTGSGGESSLQGGLPFDDEFHSRLKFNRRGLLGMANSGTKNDNASQFFLTLGKTEELTGHNTMFGRVEGNTIFNLVKMGEVDLAEGEGSERPLYPTMITGTEVLVNPFVDMVKRVRVATVQSREATVPKKKPGLKKKAAKTLLSFGGGEEGEEESTAPAIKATKFNPKLVSASPQLPSTVRPTQERAPKRRLSRSPSPPKPNISTIPLTPPRPSSASPSPSPSPRVHSPRRTAPKSALADTLASIAALKSSLKRNTPLVPSSLSSKPKSALEAMIPETSTRGRKRKAGAAGTTHAPTRDEQKALDAFRAFGKRLDHEGGAERRVEGLSTGVDADTEMESSKTMGVDAGADGEDDEALLCDLHFIAHCQSCTSWDTADTDGQVRPQLGENEADGIFTHRLTFEKDRLGKDLKWKQQNESELVVIDPREKEREIVGDKKRRAREDRLREGGRGGRGAEDWGKR